MWKWHLLCRVLASIYRDQSVRLRQLKRLQGRLAQEIGGIDTCWQATSVFPKYIDSLGVSLPAVSETAIVMQGPLVLEDNLTLETVKMYVRAMPQQQLIVSTWSDQDTNTLRAIDSLGAHVVTSSPLSWGGPSNLNRQIATTLAGMRAAQAIRAEFVLKTRTDTRLYATNVCDYLAGLCQAFPLSNSMAQRGRIILLDLATRLYVPNHASDMLMFGRLEDLVQYWECPLASPSESGSESGRSDSQGMDYRASYDGKPRTFGQLVRSSIPEVTLCQSYLERIEFCHENTVADWWRTLAELFLVVDRSTVGFFWPKYDYAVGHTMSENDAIRNLALASFRDWVNIAMFDKLPSVDLDQLAETPINGLIAA